MQCICLVCAIMGTSLAVSGGGGALIHALPPSHSRIFVWMVTGVSTALRLGLVALTVALALAVHEFNILTSFVGGLTDSLQVSTLFNPLSKQAALYPLPIYDHLHKRSGPNLYKWSVQSNV